MTQQEDKRLRLAGRVATRTGDPLPAELAVTCGGDRAQARPDSGGRFWFDGVPAGEVTVSIAVGRLPFRRFVPRPPLVPRPTGFMETAGGPAHYSRRYGLQPSQWHSEVEWQLSARNRSRQLLAFDYELTGTLEKDKDDLLLLIEPKPERPEPLSFVSFPRRLISAPGLPALWGAETSGPPFIVLSGQVVDDRTGGPVARAKLIPKRIEAVSTPPPSRTLLRRVVDWVFRTPPPTRREFEDQEETQIGSNGVFQVEFTPPPWRPWQPMLRVEAPGYAPVRTRDFTESASNLVIRLRAGAGPSGVVLRPDGQPAAHVKVVYITGRAAVSIASLNPKSRSLNEVDAESGTDGRFAFRQPGEAGQVFALDSSGVAEEAVSGLGDVLKLSLKPWASIRGTLINSNGTPASSQFVAVSWIETRPGAFWSQELGRTITDTNGGFEFNNLPPRPLILQCVSGRPAGAPAASIPYTRFTPMPGITNDLGKVPVDPPLPPIEAIMRKFGL